MDTLTWEDHVDRPALPVAVRVGEGHGRPVYVQHAGRLEAREDVGVLLPHPVVVQQQLERPLLVELARAEEPDEELWVQPGPQTCNGGRGGSIDRPILLTRSV